ncbi:hypothetical protein UFOVP166_41 [uncultured Caudovirales phage]|uniref:Uncharacterized protein n=1 Tax=uncultured Caudovirales phage TaxID=2100421 RepID=A0A6J7WEB7_9CAUD|nr:hypothetical protein UFOVP166_41 [uncultured Caudovirales phage]
MNDKSIWCDHCKATIPLNGVLSCLRRTCASKPQIDPKRKGFRQ